LTPSGERPLDRLRIAHGLLFAVGVAAAVLDLASSGFDGSSLASSISVPLVGLALGVAFAGTGRPGARVLLLVADLALIVGALASALSATTGPFESPGSVIPAAVLGGLAALALLVAVAPQPPVLEAPPQTVGHRLAVAALFGFTVITLLAPYLAMRDLPTTPILLAAMPTLAGVAVALTAWWYGSGWLLALFGIGSLAASLDVVLALSAPPSWNHLILGIGAIVMGLRAPTSVPRPDGPASPTAVGDGDGSHPSRRRRPTSAAVWAALGAVLFVPTALLGRWTPGFVDCFDACPPLSPLAEPTVPLTWLAVVFVPLAAIAVALEPRSRPGASTWTAVVGLVGAAVVLGQVALGIAGIEPFTYMTLAAPAAVLCATGFVAALAAPRWLAQTGRVAATGSAVAGLLWMAEGLGAGGGFFDLPLVEVASLVSGAVVIVALGRAFGEGAVDLPEPAGSDADPTSEAEVAEGR
jgi:hypothetical protein